jgi:hypothetical protein
MHRFLALTLSLVALVAAAIEPPKSPPGAPASPAPAGQEQPVPAPKAEPAPAPGTEPAPADAQEAEDEELPPLPADVEPAGPSPQRFNPTEKVRADFPVSFPIDI